METVRQHGDTNAGGGLGGGAVLQRRINKTDAARNSGRPCPPPREYREGHFHRRENIGKASATAARMSGRPFPPPREDREGQCRRREKIGKAISTAAKQQGGEKGIKGRTGLTGLSHLLNTSSRVPPLDLFSPLRDVGPHGAMAGRTLGAPFNFEKAHPRGRGPSGHLPTNF